jgi:hypothetical protein
MLIEQTLKYECSENIMSVSSIDVKNSKLGMSTFGVGPGGACVEFIRSFC